MTTATLTKKELKELGTDIAQAVEARSVHPFIGTWLDRPGCSVEIRLTSKSLGRRVAIHKWDNEATCEVRYVTGDFWRDPENAREFARTGEVPFAASAIIPVVREMLEA